MKKSILFLFSFFALVSTALAWGAGGAKENSYDAKSSIIMLFLVTVYYFILWLLARSNKRSEVKEEEPPHGVSAGDVYFIEAYGSCNPAREMMLLTVSLIVKWAVDLTVENGEFVIKLKNRNAPLLSEEEQIAMGIMFKDGDHIVLNADYYQIIYNSLTTGRKVLLDKTKHIFKSDFLYNIPVFLILIFFMVKIFAIPVVTSTLFMAFMAALFYKIRKPGVLNGIIFGLFLALVAGLFFAGSAWAVYILLLLTFMVMTLFLSIIKPYSQEGEKVKEHLNSFKDYLSGREINDAGENIFCDFLPYAIAFREERAWISYFKEIIVTEEGKKLLNDRGLSAFIDEEKGMSLLPFYQAASKATKTFMSLKK